jgi:23S rRNA pseudouridine955/2504/2580 synthase
MSGVQNLTVEEADAGARLDRWFKRKFPHIPHGRVEKLLRTGQLRVDGKRAKGNFRIDTGQLIRIPPLPDPTETKTKPRVSDKDAALIRDMVIYEDDDLFALNKPAGLAVQGGTNTFRHIDGMLPVLSSKNVSPRLVHRLDRDTSGLLIVAKNAKSAAWIGKAFQSRRARKVYWGITNGVPRPAEGEIKGYMAKDEGPMGREIMAPVKHGTPGAKHARTLYQIAGEAGKRAAWVVMQPLTGRKHQLRLHMQLLGTPIVYDPKYHSDREQPGGLDEILHLHARELELPHPNGDVLHLTAPLPGHFEMAFGLLGFDPNTKIDLMEA